MRPGDPKILALALRQQLISRRRSRRPGMYRLGCETAGEREKLLACPSTRNGSHLTVTGQSSQILINALPLREVVAKVSVSSKSCY